MAMNFASDMALMVTDRAVQILGGYGVYPRPSRWNSGCAMHADLESWKELP